MANEHFDKKTCPILKKCRQETFFSAMKILEMIVLLLFTAGSSRLLPKPGDGIRDSLGKLGGKVLESGGTLTVELYLQMQNGKYEAAFGIGCVLIVIILCINLAVKLTADRLHRG